MLIEAAVGSRVNNAYVTGTASNGIYSNQAAVGSRVRDTGVVGPTSTESNVNRGAFGSRLIIDTIADDVEALLSDGGMIGVAWDVGSTTKNANRTEESNASNVNASGTVGTTNSIFTETDDSNGTEDNLIGGSDDELIASSTSCVTEAVRVSSAESGEICERSVNPK